MTYASVLTWLNRLRSYERTPGPMSLRDRSRMEHLLALLSHPERVIPIIHIGGSKGKGSTVALLQAILTGIGKRVGTYTSPHIFSLRERIAIDGKPIPQGLLIRYGERVRRPVTRLGATWFETLTAIALLYFREQKVDFALLEVGLGGRLDATNAPRDKLLTALTHIEREHEDILGKGLRRITLEKLGITRPGVPLIVSAQSPTVHATMKRFCRVHDIPLTILPKAQSASEENRMLAETLFERLMKKKFSPQKLRVMLPGRMEHRNLNGRPVLFDMCHTPDSARALRQELDRLFPGKPIFFCFGTFQDKRIADIFCILVRPGDCVITTTLPHERAASAETLAHHVRAAIAIPNPTLALRLVAHLPKKVPVCITGSSAWGPVIAASSKIPFRKAW